MESRSKPRGPELGGTPTSPMLPLAAVPPQLSCCVQDSLPIIALGDVQLACRLPEVGQTCERTSAGDPSGTQHACREAAAVEEAEAECEPAEEPEQCCSG